MFHPEVLLLNHSCLSCFGHRVQFGAEQVTENMFLLSKQSATVGGAVFLCCPQMEEFLTWENQLHRFLTDYVKQTHLLMNF